MLRPLRAFILGLAAGLCWTLPAIAQTVTSTAGTGNVGTQQLNTLFHSFEDFSPTTANVLFQLDSSQNAVEQVIGRVTGSNASLINGQLALTGGNSPDLFLIKPNGITFGNNARLNLPGSFLASTAESILFEDNLEFSATTPTAAPLLTLSSGESI